MSHRQPESDRGRQGRSCKARCQHHRHPARTHQNLIAHGINVNALAPGVVDGDHWDGVDAFFAKHEGKPPGQKTREVAGAVPKGRMGTATDLTGTAIFLATPEAKCIVARCFGADGGKRDGLT
ncbi:SDR family oxidoreductase [Pseudotabrizicola sediminis]|uniref:SDR family oxidoreductase n=2 Tax=Pseudotabrizicola sediminis TaxID=2486418 RepID=A0ABY2KMP4_9RHOB|nr:SDR family oxidoreductase [Pseudotabrizicola sediminis]